MKKINSFFIPLVAIIILPGGMTSCVSGNRLSQIAYMPGRSSGGDPVQHAVQNNTSSWEFRLINFEVTDRSPSRGRVVNYDPCRSGGRAITRPRCGHTRFHSDCDECRRYVAYRRSLEGRGSYGSTTRWGYSTERIRQAGPNGYVPSWAR